MDVRALRGLDGGADLRPEAVAGYIAKYTTKSTGDAGGTDRHIACEVEIGRLHVSDHYRALMGTCWWLGGLPELEQLRLREWADTLGYRGHCLTKSRRYSTTYGALRRARADHRRVAAGRLLLTDWEAEGSWHFVGCGYTPGEVLLASAIAEDLSTAREFARGGP